MALPSAPVILRTRHAMPAFVIGFELPDEAAMEHVKALVPHLPSFVQLHEHQYGGYSCLQAWLLGATLRFEPNADKPHGRVPLTAFRQGLASLGEFGREEVPTRALHPEVAWLNDLAPTYGTPYDEMDRKLLQATMEDAVPGLPPIDEAVEALVRLSPGIPQSLLSWRMFTAPSEGPSALDDWNFDEAEHSDDLELTEERARELQALGEAATLGPVRTFLLWENSD